MTLPRGALPSVQAVRAVTRLTGLAAWRGFVEFYRSDAMTHAAAIAYYALLSLFPCLLLISSIAAAATSDAQDRATILAFIMRYLPGRFEFFRNQLDHLQQQPLKFGLAGGAVLIWSSLGVFGAITAAVDHAWGVERQRSYWKHKLVSFAMLGAAGILLLVAILLMGAIEVVNTRWFGSASFARSPVLVWLKGIGARYSATLLLIVVFGFIYYFIPNAKVRFRDVWVGAVVVGLLWKGAFVGFAWYIKDMSRFEGIHGSLAAVVVFLFWIYISSVLLLYGADFTAAYARLRRRRPEEAPAAPAPRV